MPTLLLVTVMLTRLQILELLVFFLDELRRKVGRERRDAVMIRDVSSAKWWSRLGHFIKRLDDWVYEGMERIRNQQVVFFTRGVNDDGHEANRKFPNTNLCQTVRNCTNCVARNANRNRNTPRQREKLRLT